MRSTGELVKEHDVILKAIETLEKLVELSRRNGGAPVSELRRILEFLKVFVDKCHHGKEEKCLFPCLEKLGVPREGGPIGVMLAEHEMGRKLVKSIEERLTGYERGETNLEELLAPCVEYCNLIRQHIWKENNILFPTGEQLMTGEEDASNLSCYGNVEKTVGEGVHERMEKLVEEVSEKSKVA